MRRNPRPMARWFTAAAAILSVGVIGRDIAEVRTVSQPIARADFRVRGASGLELFVRNVRQSASAPVLLVHGGAPGGLVTFDLDVPEYSFAARLAEEGFDVYVMDVRGFGRSTRPSSLDASDPSAPPAVTSEEVVEDVGAVVAWIQARTSARRVALIGHASGGHWAGMYTAAHNDIVSHLVMINSMYGVRAAWSLSQGYEDPARPGEFDPRAGACRLADRNGLVAGWDRSIPESDKSHWRDPRVAEAYIRMAFETDPTASTRNPPSVCIPGGFRRDHFLMAQGKKFWDAKDVRVPTLVVRGARDHWSRPEDLEGLRAALVNAQPARTLVLPESTHFFFLDRSEHGMATFMRELIPFLRQPS